MTFYQWRSPSAMNQLFPSLQIFVVTTFPYMSQETENTKRMYSGPLFLCVISITTGWCGIPQGDVFLILSGNVQERIHASLIELLGLDTNPEAKLFIKVISYITETDITAQKISF